MPGMLREFALAHVLFMRRPRHRPLRAARTSAAAPEHGGNSCWVMRWADRMIPAPAGDTVRFLVACAPWDAESGSRMDGGRRAGHRRRPILTACSTAGCGTRCARPGHSLPRPRCAPRTVRWPGRPQALAATAGPPPGRVPLSVQENLQATETAAACPAQCCAGLGALHPVLPPGARSTRPTRSCATSRGRPASAGDVAWACSSVVGERGSVSRGGAIRAQRELDRLAASIHPGPRSSTSWWSGHSSACRWYDGRSASSHSAWKFMWNR